MFCRHHGPEGLFADDGLPVGLDGAPAVAGGSRLIGGLDAQGARLRFGTRTRDGRWVLDLADGGTAARGLPGTLQAGTTTD